MRYPVTLDIEAVGVLAGCPDIPEMHSVGDTVEEALKEAADGLESAIEIYFDARRPVPLPSRAARGQKTVAISALTAAKVLLHNEMLAQNVKKADLARALQIAPSNVERIFRVRHKTRIETLEAALGCMGKHLDVRLA
ncbi:MAG: type II toxin-antitoxin system HicB family antitoxin [Azoarcus sp.]|jgi:antitoxin HicB|nr:type II toxin-antitoxin system HicB family antitoxin [Azoarcus sp.]